MSLMSQIWHALRFTLRVLHRLWLEVTGTLFLGLAMFGTVSAWKEWNAYPQNGLLWKPVAAICFVVMMAGFGIYSFLKARRLR
jgi:hypothetical protein